MKLKVWPRMAARCMAGLARADHRHRGEFPAGGEARVPHAVDDDRGGALPLGVEHGLDGARERLMASSKPDSMDAGAAVDEAVPELEVRARERLDVPERADALGSRWA